MCDCREKIDEKLAPKNCRIAVGFTIGSGSMGLAPPMIETEKIDKSKRGKPPFVLATYCPFCGDKFTEGPTAT